MPVAVTRGITADPAGRANCSDSAAGGLKIMRVKLPSTLVVCTVILAVALLAWPALAAEPVLLPSREAATVINPFQAALSDTAATAQSSAQRFLGRPHSTAPSMTADSAELGPTDEGDAIHWGHTAIMLSQYPLTEPRPDQAIDKPDPQPPAAAANLGCDQEPPLLVMGSTRLDVTSLLASGDGLGITSVDFRPAIESPHLPGASLRPILGMHVLSGPTQTDLPGQVYDISLEGRMYVPCGERWLCELALAPGIFTDFRNTDDAFRLVARGIAFYKCSQTLRIAVGGTYLDREDITWLPIGGVVWVPNEDWRYELVFPRPRITHRVWGEGERERWVYLLGELGGGSWAIERANGAADIGTYRDYRLFAGIEFKQGEGHSWLLEAGWSFARELEYVSHVGDYSPDPAAIVRAALTF